MKKMHTCTCDICHKEFKDTWDECFICTDCDNEYAEWLAEMGYVVGEFDDKSHPKYKPDALRGTKWEVLSLPITLLED
jgi:hypothetical protein